MLTRKRWIPPNIPPSLPPELQEYIRNQNKSISDYLLSLEGKGALTINEAEITASQGIKFPATQVASTDANTLDDYEEGSWTPGISFGGGTTGITYSLQAGSYTKIGNRCMISGRVDLSAKGSSTGAARITGLPFTVRNSNASWAVPSLYMLTVTFANQHQGYFNLNTTTIDLLEVTEAGSGSTLTDADFANTSVIFVSGIYEIA